MIIRDDITAKEWCLLYEGLDIIEEKCQSCPRRVRTVQPFITKDWVGLEAKVCKCGRNPQLKVRVPRGQYLRERIRSFAPRETFEPVPRLFIIK